VAGARAQRPLAANGGRHAFTERRVAWKQPTPSAYFTFTLCSPALRRWCHRRGGIRLLFHDGMVPAQSAAIACGREAGPWRRGKQAPRCALPLRRVSRL